MKNKQIKRCLLFLMTAAAALGIPAVCPAPVLKAKAAASETIQEPSDRKIDFNKGWKFFLDVNENLAAESRNYDDSSWEDVSIPHDFSITQDFSNNNEAESGFLPGGTGWYRKSAIFPQSYENKSVILNFDGVYNNAYVYVNGKKLGEHHYGYTNFAFDISDALICDGSTENVIAVKAVHEFPSSRWYSGSGIYRDVTLIITNPVHVSLNGTYVTTPNLQKEQGKDVTVHVETSVQNDSSTTADTTVRTTIQNAEGTIVSKEAAEDNISVDSGKTFDLTQNVAVNNPSLWSCDSPNLYYVKTEILSGGKITDTCITEFGFRYFNFDADTGFSLNGQNMKLKGVCIHHDQGALGAAAYKDAIYRQVKILKDMGCNAIRTSHNAHCKLLLEACNEFGILVMDEVFDGWSYTKNGNSGDFARYFNQTLGIDNAVSGGSPDKTWVQFVLQSLINRDKNDPCVVMWSIGNELPTVCNIDTTNPSVVKEFTDNASDMIRWIQEIDSSKPITCGDNEANFSSTSDFRTKIDELITDANGVAGLNYSPNNYVYNHMLHPSWPLVATETASCNNSRGIYYTTGQSRQTGNYQCTAYDTEAVSWGQTARQAWLPIISNDFISGTFVWTGFDYIGEPTPWNKTNSGSESGDEQPVPNSSYFGIIDTAGFPKDSYYFYTSQWREDQTTLHIVPGCWNKDDLLMDANENVKVDIYSNAYKIELLLNGKVIGTAVRNSVLTNAGYEYGMYNSVSKNPDKCSANNSIETDPWNNLAAQFYVKYESGTLSAKAYDKNNREITRTIGIKQATTNSDNGSCLLLTPETSKIQADGYSLSYIDVDVLDANGEFASQADCNIRFSLTGNGEIVGVDNGNPSTIHKFQHESVLPDKKSANINAFSGKALVIVRSTDKSGGFVLRAESDGMTAQTAEINTDGKIPGDIYIKNYDLKTYYTVDLGTKPDFQLNTDLIMSDNTKFSTSVEWNAIPEEAYEYPGNYQINGFINNGTDQIPVTASLYVKPVIAAVKCYSKASVSGVIPALPDTVSGILPNGRLYGNYPVTWNAVSASDFSKAGNIVTVNGLAKISEDQSMPAKITIRVAESVKSEPKNIAADYKSLTETCYPTSDNLYSITDKNTLFEVAAKDPDNRWTNWLSAKLNSSPTIIFKWDEVHTLSQVNLYFFANEVVETPQNVSFYFSENGVDYHEVENIKESNITSDASGDNKVTYTFPAEINASSLKITFKPKETQYVGLIECEIYDSGITYQKNNTALLSALSVNKTAVAGFDPNNCSSEGYTVSIDTNFSNAVIEAEAKDNASVTIVPVNDSGTVNILVQSEDESVINIYKLNLVSNEDEIIKQLEAEAAKTLSDANNKKETDYTPESWQIFKTALNALQEAITNKTSAEIKARLEELKRAMQNLKPKESENYPRANTFYNTKKERYKITSSSPNGGTVTFIKPLKKTNTKFTVGSVVMIHNLPYKITKIEKNAFKNNKRLSKITLGNNITNIGSSAFFGDKKLKLIIIKTSKLKTVGKSAFKGISPKAVIKVRKSKYKKYRKLLKNKGQRTSVKLLF